MRFGVADRTISLLSLLIRCSRLLSLPQLCSCQQMRLPPPLPPAPLAAAQVTMIT